MPASNPMGARMSAYCSMKSAKPARAKALAGRRMPRSSVMRTITGGAVAESKSRWMISIPDREGAVAGRIEASGTPKRICENGLPSKSRKAMTSRKVGTARRMTSRDSPAQKAPLMRMRGIMRAALMRGPSMPRTAGRKVTFNTTAMVTTVNPPRPIERRLLKGSSSRAKSPMTTAMPEKATAWPAVPTVVATASSTGRRSISSRKRLTIKRE